MILATLLFHACASASPPTIHGERVFTLTYKHRLSYAVAVDDVPPPKDGRWFADLDKILARSCEVLLQSAPRASRYTSDAEPVGPGTLSANARRTFGRLRDRPGADEQMIRVDHAFDEIVRNFPAVVATEFERLDRAETQAGLKAFRMNPALSRAVDLAEGRRVSAREVYNGVLYGADAGAAVGTPNASDTPNGSETLRELVRARAYATRIPVEKFGVEPPQRFVTPEDLERTLIAMGRMLAPDRVTATYWNLKIARTLRTRFDRRFFRDDPVTYGRLKRLLERASDHPAPRVPVGPYDDATVDRILGHLEYSGTILVADADRLIPGMSPDVARALLDVLADRGVRIDIARVGRPALRVVK